MKKDSIGYKVAHPLEALKGWMQQSFWQRIDLTSGLISASGVEVNSSNALGSAAYYAGISFRARTVAQLPLVLYERKERGKERAIHHQLYELLHDAPNSEMTAYDFKEAMEGHRWTWGNAYAEIEWDPKYPVPTALWPLRPDMMVVERDSQTKQLVYRYFLPTHQQVILQPHQVLHIPNLGFDGTIGYDPIKMHRDTIGYDKALKTYGSKFFKNGAYPGGVLIHPDRVSDPAKNSMRESWESIYGGLDKSHRIAILEEGVSYQAIGIPPENAQFLESRKFSVTDMARILNLPPHIIFDLSNATFSNIEQQSLELVIYHLMPDFIRWAQRAKLRLLPGLENKNYFPEFLIAGLLRGDSAARASFYQALFGMGAISPNEIDEIENLPLSDSANADKRYVMLNMTPIDDLGPLDAGIAPDENNEEELPATEPGAKQIKAVRNNRHRIARAHERLFTRSAAKLVKTESAAVLKALKDDVPMAEWIKDYYKTFPALSKGIMGGVFTNLAISIETAARDEVRTEVETTDKVDDFVESFNQSFTKRHISSSQGQLIELLSEEDPTAAIETRVTEWKDKRPSKISANETVQLANGVAKTVFAASGVQKLMWLNTGSDTCDFCQEMNGKIVGIDQPFLNEHDEITGGSGKLHIRGPKTQPPIHQGCSCVIMPA